MGEIVTVNFRGDDLYGFKEDDGTFLAIKPMVEAIGLNWQGQHDRVHRDPVLSQGIRVMRIPFGRGGAQETLCIKLELVNGWLFGIDSARRSSRASLCRNSPANTFAHTSGGRLGWRRS